jgi:UDP-N-acetylmuramoyl-L-alanyl-D-glutamate--2,6-diaminopimelate ligase
MGEIATHLADQVVITSDNPRTEDPDSIIRMILAGVPQGRSVHVESDRRAAIGWAISQAESGEIVLIAGKGHETYQIIGNRQLDFDDRVVALAFLS